MNIQQLKDINEQMIQNNHCLITAESLLKYAENKITLEVATDTELLKTLKNAEQRAAYVFIETEKKRNVVEEYYKKAFQYQHTIEIMMLEYQEEILNKKIDLENKKNKNYMDMLANEHR